MQRYVIGDRILAKEDGPPISGQPSSLMLRLFT
jgi:hypothetical protein